MDYYTVILLFLLESIRATFATQHLACYSCIYNPALREGTSIMTSSSWLPKLRHQDRTNSLAASKRHRGYSEIVNTKLCAIHPGKNVKDMPVRICPKIAGYQEFCHREYVTENNTVTHVSRDCFYTNQHRQILLSSETLDPATMVIKRRQEQICSSSLCNQDKNLVAKFAAVTMATTGNGDNATTSQELKTLEETILNRGRRAPATVAPTNNNVYHLDNEPRDGRLLGNDASPRNDGDEASDGDEDHGRFDEDAEVDDEEENYYNADGSGVNIEFTRWYPTDFPNSAQRISNINCSFHRIVHMALLITLVLFFLV